MQDATHAACSIRPREGKGAASVLIGAHGRVLSAWILSLYAPAVVSTARHSGDEVAAPGAATFVFTRRQQCGDVVRVSPWHSRWSE